MLSTINEVAPDREIIFAKETKLGLKSHLSSSISPHESIFILKTNVFRKHIT